MKKTKPAEKTRRRFEEDGEFFVGSAGDGDQVNRLLCFRNHLTKAVGASIRFSREEAWRKSRRGVPVALGKEGALA